MSEFTTFSNLVKTRRSNLRIDADKPVDHELIASLCELAIWAPNHHHTWPWRFAVLEGESRAELGRLAAKELANDGVIDEKRLAKTRTKYLRAPAMLVVGSQSTERPEAQADDFDAVAAGVQNLLLAATAAGLASFWASPGPSCNSNPVRELCGFSLDTQIRALIYLGWPKADATVVERPEPAINWIN